MRANRCHRDGERDVIETTNLVPGDVAILEEGCCVPADLRLVEAVNLEIMEAVITGESAPVQKEVGKLPSRTPLAEQTNMAFMSTVVLKGKIVFCVVSHIRQGCRDCCEDRQRN